MAGMHQSFQYGTMSWVLPKMINDSTHGWEVFVKPLGEEHELKYVDKVKIELHPTLKPPVVVKTRAPFVHTTEGWGEFEIRIYVFFKFGLGSWHASHLLKFPDPPSKDRLCAEEFTMNFDIAGMKSKDRLALFGDRVKFYLTSIGKDFGDLLQISVKDIRNILEKDIGVSLKPYKQEITTAASLVINQAGKKNIAKVGDSSSESDSSSDSDSSDDSESEMRKKNYKRDIEEVSRIKPRESLRNPKKSRISSPVRSRTAAVGSKALTISSTSAIVGIGDGVESSVSNGRPSWNEGRKKVGKLSPKGGREKVGKKPSVSATSKACPAASPVTKPSRPGRLKRTTSLTTAKSASASSTVSERKTKKSEEMKSNGKDKDGKDEKGEKRRSGAALSGKVSKGSIQEKEKKSLDGDGGGNNSQSAPKGMESKKDNMDMKDSLAQNSTNSISKGNDEKRETKERVKEKADVTNVSIKQSEINMTSEKSNVEMCADVGIGSGGEDLLLAIQGKIQEAKGCLLADIVDLIRKSGVRLLKPNQPGTSFDLAEMEPVYVQKLNTLLITGKSR
eukprot:CFRG0933T1